MAQIVAARAWCNNEVGFLAWKANGKIDRCLGFLITRIHLDRGERRILPAWAAVGRAPSQYGFDAHIARPGDPIREFLAGDVLPTLKSMFERAGQENGHLHMALYELDDQELLALLEKHHKRLSLILCTAGNTP